MTAFLDFSVPSDGFVLGRALDVPAARRVELTQFVPIGEDLIPYFWAETDDADALVSQVLASPHVADVEELDGVTGRKLFRVEWEESVDGLLDTLQRCDIAVQRAVTSGRSWRFEVVAADHAALVEFQADCREDGIDIDVIRLSSGGARESGLYGLTDKQREALLRAYEAGYYDMDTCVTLTRVSEGMDISQQALGARIKRGTGALIRNTIAESARIKRGTGALIRNTIAESSG